MDELTEVEMLRQLRAKDKEIIGLLWRVIDVMLPLLPDHAQETLKKLLPNRKPADALQTGSEVQERSVGQ